MRFHARRVAVTVLATVTAYVFFISTFFDQQFLGGGLQHSGHFISQQRNRIANLHGWYKREEGAELWPSEFQPHHDRIINQIRFVPSAYGQSYKGMFVNSSEQKMKVIFAPAGLGDTPMGRKKFLIEQCPVDRCILSSESAYRFTADAVLFQNEYITDVQRQPGQIWILWLLESPFNTGDFRSLKNYINWTATYRSDSTIVTPYEKFVHFENFTSLPVKPLRNYAKGKTKQVAWFVSNCGSNNRRFEYAQELQNHIEVDIYGACGTHSCPRTHRDECENLLKRDYKFYLAFENSNCVHYITEKFYWNSLFVDVIPVVMGARKEDYAAVAPPHSFIHVEDFESPLHLAKYLHQLDQDDDLFNSYFRWKGTGYFLNTKFWCRLCAMVHGADDSVTSRWYDDVEGWWRNNDTCVRDRWDDPDGKITNWGGFVF